MKTLTMLLVAVMLVACGTTTPTGVDQQTLSAIESLALQYALQYASTGKVQFNQASATALIQKQFPQVPFDTIVTNVQKQYAKQTAKPSPTPKPK